MDLLDRRVGAWTWRSRCRDAIAAGAPWLAVGLMCTALTAAITRLCVPGEQPHAVVWALAIAALLCPWWPAWLAWRRERPRWRIAAEIDRACGADGLVMARAESAQAQWDERLRAPLLAVRLPRVAVRPLLPAACCAALIAAVPLLPMAVQPARSNPARAVVQPLAQRVDALIERGMVSDSEAERLKKAMEQVSAQAEKGMDQAGWDALDRLDRQVDTAQRVAQAKLSAVLTAAAAAAQSKRKPGDAANAAQADNAAADLTRAMALMVDTPRLLPRLTASQAAVARRMATAAALAGAIDPGKADALAKALGGADGSENPFQDSHGLSPDELAALGDFVAKALEQFRDQAPGLENQQPGDGDQAHGQGNDGNGAPDRGPGHPELERIERERFAIGASETLPAGVRLNADGSLTIAESVRDPSAEERVIAAAQAAVSEMNGAAADARSTRVAPRHRATVQGYFTTDATDAPPPTPAR